MKISQKMMKSRTMKLEQEKRKKRKLKRLRMIIKKNLICPRRNKKEMLKSRRDIQNCQVYNQAHFQKLKKTKLNFIQQINLICLDKMMMEKQT